MSTISKRSLFLAGGAALLAAALPVATRAQAQPVKNRAVFQVTDNDPARWNMILNNMINLKEGENVTYDLKEDRDDPTSVGTSEYADAIIDKIEEGVTIKG